MTPAPARGGLKLGFVIPVTVMASTLVAAALALSLSSRLARESAYDDGALAVTARLSRHQLLLETALRRGDLSLVQETVASLGGDRSVTAVAVLGPDGRVVASTHLADVGRPVEELRWPPAARAAFAAGKTRRGPVIERAADELVVWGAIALNEARAEGQTTLLIAVDVAPRWGSDMRDARFAVALFAALMLLTAAMATVVFQRVITRRTKPVLDAARRLAGGELSARTGVVTADEVGAMAEVFDEMAAQLEERQQATLAAEQRYRTVFEQAADGIFIASATGELLEANPAGLALVGYSNAELRGLTFEKLLPADEQGAPASPLDRVQTEGAHTRHLTLVTKKAERVPVELAVTALPDGRLMSVARDQRPKIDAERLRAQVALNERLAVLGNLAAGVGHEINNPLTYVLQHLDEAERELPEGQTRQLLRDARDGADRVARIVADLRIFTRPADDPHPGPVSLEKAVRTTLNLMGPSARDRLTVKVELGAQPPVRADERRLCQVLLNLVQNAALAMPEGRPVAENVLRFTASRRGAEVALEVRDNGCGIAPEVLPRIFEPYFTTRAATVGTGLGLAISRQLLERMGARIEVTSSVGQGTCFTITFQVEAEAAKPAPPAAPAVEGGARLRVLVVDDEPLVARATARMLDGHDVTVASGPAAALEQCEATGFDLILCDLSMPDGGGPRLFAELKAKRPALVERLVFVTGGAASAEAARFLDETKLPVLQKPFDRATLRALLTGRAGKG